MNKIMCGLAFGLATSGGAFAQMNLSEVPVTFYGEVKGRLAGLEVPLHFGDLSMRFTPRQNPGAALDKQIELVTLSYQDGPIQKAWSYAVDLPYHFGMEITAPEYHRAENLSDSLAVGENAQSIDFENIVFNHNGVDYPAALASAAGAAYNLSSANRADSVRLDIVVDLPASLSSEEPFTTALYDAFIASLPVGATNTGKGDDYDGDGISNYDEILQGRNPLLDEGRPTLQGEATRSAPFKLVDEVWRPMWIPISSGNYEAQDVFVLLRNVPEWLELRDHTTGQSILQAHTCGEQTCQQAMAAYSLADFQAGKIWARAKSPSTGAAYTGSIGLSLGSKGIDSISDEVLALAIEQESLSKRDGLDSRVWLNGTVGLVGNEVVGQSGHASDIWLGEVSTTVLDAGIQGEQQALTVAPGRILKLQDSEQGWLNSLGQGTVTMSVLLTGEKDQVLFSDGQSVVQHLNAAHPLYPNHIVVTKPLHGLQWISRMPVEPGWHVVSLQSKGAENLQLWLNGEYAASIAASTGKQTQQLQPAIGAWVNVDEYQVEHTQIANGLMLGDFLAYDKVLDDESVRKHAAWLSAKWQHKAWLDRRSALIEQTATISNAAGWFEAGRRGSVFIGSDLNDTFMALGQEATFTGGAGQDHFVVANNVIITDFAPEQGDSINLTALFAKVSTQFNWEQVVEFEIEGTDSRLWIRTPDGSVNNSIVFKNRQYSTQELVTWWRSGQLNAGQFKPFTQLSLDADEIDTLSEQGGEVREIRIHTQGVGIPFEQHLALEFFGEATTADYSVRFQDINGRIDSESFDYYDADNQVRLRQLNGAMKITLQAKEDAIFEGLESQNTRIVAMPEWYQLGDSVEVETQLTDGDDRVRISVDYPLIGEGSTPNSALITLSRSGAIDKPLDVELEFLGDAILGQDYQYVSPVVHFAAGKVTASISLKALPDRFVEEQETIEVVIKPKAGYVPLGVDRVQVKIADMPQTVTLGQVEPYAVTSSDIEGVVLAERVGLTHGDMLVGLDFNGTAKNGVDFEYVSQMLEFADDKTAEQVKIKPISTSDKSLKFVDIALKEGVSHQLGEVAKQRVYIVSSFDADEDFDGMPDYWELTNTLDPFVESAHYDSDGDGLRDLDEYQQGADPRNGDTDGDGIIDGLDADPVNASVGAEDKQQGHLLNFNTNQVRTYKLDPARTALYINANETPSYGITLRVYYNSAQLQLSTPELPISVGLMSYQNFIKDDENSDNNSQTDAYAQWVFYRAEQDWYARFKELSQGLALEWRWLSEQHHGSQSQVTAHIFANSDELIWQDAYSTIEAVVPEQFDLDQDGVHGTEQDLEHSLQSIALSLHGNAQLTQEDKSQLVKNVAEHHALLDIDGDGSVTLFVDGLLMQRYQKGLRGEALIKNVLTSRSSRNRSEEIERYLAELMRGQ